MQVHRLTLVHQFGPHGEAHSPEAHREVRPFAGHLELALPRGEPGSADLQPTRWYSHVSTDDVEVAGEPDERQGGSVVLHTVCMVHNGSRAGHESGGLGGGVEARGFAYLLGRDSGDALHPFRAEVFDIGAILGKAHRVFSHEIAVVEAFLDDDVRHPQSQGSVRAGLELEMDVGEARHGRFPGIDYDELHASIAGIEQPSGAGGVGVEGIGAPDKQAAGVADVRPGRLTIDQLEGHGHGGMAGARLGGVVGAAVFHGEPLHERPHVLGIPHEEDHRLGAALGLEPFQVGYDRLQGFVPRDRHEIAGPPRSHPFERRAEPVLVIDVLPGGCPLRAESPRAVRILFGALHLDDAPVEHVAVQAALGGGVADRAHRLANLYPRLWTGYLALPHAFKLVHVILPARFAARPACSLSHRHPRYLP